MIVLRSVRSMVLKATICVGVLAAGVSSQSCDSSTGSGGGVTGGQCIENASAVTVDRSSPDGTLHAPWNGEDVAMASVQVPPASTKSPTDLQNALGLVANGGLVLATGGEFRQTIGLVQTHGFDSRHPFHLSIGYRSYLVEFWRQDGDAVGTLEDPFGPGWRASWGDLLWEPDTNGNDPAGIPVVRVDENGARWTHSQVSASTVSVEPPGGGPDNPTTWRIYGAESGTRLLLEYYWVGGQAVPVWFREWPDRTRAEYFHPAGASGSHQVVKRIYRGDYASPDWEVHYNYDATSGRLTSIVDARGIVHSFTWTTYGTTARVTKLTSSVPTAWSPSWAAIEQNFEYETSAPYRLSRVRKPARVFLDDQDRSGVYEQQYETFDNEVITYFVYDGTSNRIAKVFDESTGLARQMLEVDYDTFPNPSWRVESMTEGVASTLPGQGPRTQTFTYGTSPDSTTWTDARLVVRTYTYTKTVGGTTYSSPRQWRVTSLTETPGANDPRPTNDPNHHGTLTWGFGWGCGCGQLTEVTMPSGLKHVISYDTAGRGLVTKTAVIPAGQSSELQVRSWTYRSWDDSDYRLASRLSGYTDACNKSGTNTFTIDSTYQGYRIDGTFAGTTLFSIQEDSKGRVLWTQEGAFLIDGTQNASYARTGLTYGTNSGTPDHGLLTQVVTYAANGATVYSTRSFTYEGLGWLRTLTDELGRTTTFAHNDIGQVTSVTLPTTASGRGTATYGGTVSFKLDRYGQVARTTQSAHDDQGTAYAHGQVVQTQVFDYFSRPWKEFTDTTKLGQSTATSLVTTYEYDAGNLLVRVEASGGRITEYRLDDHGKLYQRRQKIDGSTWAVEEHGYHADGVIARVKEPTGREGTVDTLDDSGRPLRIHLPGDKHVYLTVDLEDRLTVREFRKGASGSTLLQEIETTYDDFGRRTSDKLSAPGLATTRTTTYTYNGPFRLAMAADDEGRGATYGYDAQGRLVRKQDRLLGTSGNAEVYTRDLGGNVTRVEHVEQKQTGASTYTTETSRIDLAYDNWDRLLRAEFYGTGSTLEFTRYHGYDSLGNATWSEDGVGKQTRRAFDAAGRIVDEWLHQRTFSSTPVHLGRVYNDAPSDSLLSAILQRTDGLGNMSEYRYDLLGRLVERRLPGYTSGQIGKQWLYSYDLSGRLTGWRDGNGTAVTQVFDDDEKRLVQRRVTALPTNGVLLSRMATHETWTHDDFGRVAAAETWWNTYPAFEQAPPSSLVKAEDAYDGLGRQTEEGFTYYGVPAKKNLVYGYNKPGGGEDASFRRTMTTTAPFVVGTTPDGAGRLASMSFSGPGHPTQALADWRYVGSRPLRRGFLPGAAGGAELVTDYSYNTLRHMTQLTSTRVGTPDVVLYDLGMARDVEGNVTTHEYDKAGTGVGDWFLLDGWDRLLEAKLGVGAFTGSYAAATFDKKVTYALDVAHNRTQVDEESGGTTASTFYTRTTGTNEYQDVTTPDDQQQAWLYDGNGNLLSDGYYLYVYDHLDRLSEVYLLTYPGGATDMTESGPVVRVYGVEPQQKRDGKETPVPTQLWRQKVERARQRVDAARAAANRPAGDPRLPMGVNAGTSGTAAAAVDEPVGVLVAYYGYDPSNRRIGKLLADFSGQFYAWSGWDLVEAYDMSLQANTVWFEGGVIDEHLGYAVKVGTTWVRYGYVQDHLRGIAQVVDAAGAVVEQYEYDPYGRMSVFTDVGVPNGSVPTVPGQVYGFTGRQVDPETGLMYYRHRYYQPGHGRFLTKDPIEAWRDDASWGNAYSYCGSEPGGRADPSGLWSPEAHDMLIAHAFDGLVSEWAVEWMKREGRKFDSETQGEEDLHKHSMRSTSDWTPEAIARSVMKRDAFICDMLGQARLARQQGRIDDAYRLLSAALHTIMDSTSPAHVDRMGVPRAFFSIPIIVGCLVDVWPHIPGVGKEDPEDIDDHVRDYLRDAMRSAFESVFGSTDGTVFPEPECPPPPPPYDPRPYGGRSPHPRLV